MEQRANGFHELISPFKHLLLPSLKGALKLRGAFCLRNKGDRPMAKTYAKSFYHSKEWQSVRAYVLMRDKYKCTVCGDAKDLEVHHIVHISPENIGDTRITLNEKNLVTLCRDCHFKQHELDRANGHTGQRGDSCSDEYYFDKDGMLRLNPNYKK